MKNLIFFWLLILTFSVQGQKEKMTQMYNSFDFFLDSHRQTLIDSFYKRPVCISETKTFVMIEFSPTQYVKVHYCKNGTVKQMEWYNPPFTQSDVFKVTLENKFYTYNSEIFEYHQIRNDRYHILLTKDYD